MSDLLQSGNYPPGRHPNPSFGGDRLDSKHPDADQLNAFVEHTLPEHDRLETLAHLAQCAQCREIVALSVPPLEDAAQVRRGALVLPRSDGSLTRWFSGWNLLWIAAPALAILVVFTFYLPSMRRRAAQVAESRPSSRPAPLPSARSSAPPESASKLKHGPGRRSEESLQRKPAVESKRVNERPAGGHKAALTTPPSVAVRGNNVQPRAVPATAKVSQSAGGRVILQSSMAGMAYPARRVPQTGAAALALSKQTAHAFALAQTPAQVAAPPGSAQAQVQTLTGTAPPIASASATPQPPPLVLNQANVAAPASSDSLAMTVNAQEIQSNVAITGGKVPDELAETGPKAAPRNVPVNVAGSVAGKAAPMAVQTPLPSGLAATSLATSLHRRLALDSGNQLFLSEDDGQHWRAVSAVGRGRAMTVSTVATIPAASLHPPTPLALSVPERYTRGAVASVEPDTDRVTSLSGTVTDASGAVVPGATIVVTDNHTAFIRSVQTDATGHYLVEELPPGVYRLEAQAAGFQKQSQIAVVSSAQQAVKNLVFSVAQSSQTVTVAAASAQLQTSSRSMPPAAANTRKMTPVTPVHDLLPIFVITTESGDRWTSPDGLTWKHE